jgi:hypothetical protein
MKRIEYWRWRYRDAQLGCIRRTSVGLTEQEAAEYPQAERIDGTLSVRYIDDEIDRNRDDLRAKETDCSDLIMTPQWRADCTAR